MSASLLGWLRSRRVAVLKGGWSRERAISLKTGAAVEASFRRMAIPFFSINVQPNIMSVLQKKKIQFCWIALHGLFGEDGGIQCCLEDLKIPYTGSGVLASALAMNKDLSKRIFVDRNVPTPLWVTVERKSFFSSPNESLQKAVALLQRGPVFVKPIDQGSAFGISSISKASQLTQALKKCFRFSETAMVEKFINGRELTVGILGVKALPVTEIIPAHSFYDFHSKYAPGGSKHVTPASLTSTQTHSAQRLALQAFNVLQCSVYGRVDILMNSKNQMVVLEVNTIPGMTGTSLLPEAARAAGIDFDELVMKIVQHSLDEKKGVSKVV